MLGKMAWWLHLIFIIAILEGTNAQSVVLTQVGSELKKPGDSVQLKCATSGFVLNDWYMAWIRQKPGQGLQWLVSYWKPSQTNYYLPGIQGRFTASKDSSNFYLQMNNLTPEDSAVYYCARGYYSGSYWYFDYWGKGTKVTVTSATPTAPAVFPLSPCCQDLSTASKVTFGCLITGYFPEPVTVQWNSGAISTGIRTFPAIAHSSGHYTLSSQLTVPVSSWESGNFRCNVVHTATSSSLNQEIERCVSRDPVSPEVRLLHSSCNPRSSDATIELLCIISGFYPSEVTVEWLVGGKSGLLSSHTEPPREDTTGHTFSTTSTANISQADWLEGNAYSCQVTHAASQTTVKSRAKRCEGESPCQSIGINVYLRPPTPNDLYINRDAKVSCVVGNLESSESLKLRWSREKAASLNPEPSDVSEELNGTYTVVSDLPISGRDWASGETFTCTVEYPGLAAPIVKKISKIEGKTTAPSVYLFRPHHEEVTLRSQEHLTITCLVKNFKPADISVQWLKNHNALTEDNHINTPVLKDSTEDGYFFYSMLTIPRADWNMGSTYTCMVIHEGLSMKFTQRSVEKSQGKK